MAVPDISSLTPAELQDLINAATARFEQIVRETADVEANLRGDILAATAGLEALIGDGDPKGFTSIMAVRQFSGEAMVSAAATVLPVIVHGMELLARAQLDVARVVGR